MLLSLPPISFERSREGITLVAAALSGVHVFVAGALRKKTWTVLGFRRHASENISSLRVLYCTADRLSWTVKSSNTVLYCTVCRLVDTLDPWSNAHWMLGALDITRTNVRSTGQSRIIQ